MTAANAPTEELLVDVLDEALREIRRGKTVDSSTWRQTYPEFSEEGTQLLETLVLLSAAADTWRGTDPGDSPARSSQPTQAGRSLPAMIGRYRIHGIIGSGAMGEVFDGYDPQLDRRVAVKVPHCERLTSNRTVFTERFIREARAAAAVRHAHICPVYDTGQHDEQPYVVMAFVDGESLDALLSRGRIEDVRRAAELTAQVAEALDAIHQQGIIHRDLKPGNILIDQAGHALLTDFGLAVSSVNVERLTSDGLIVGTPVYMSPEQAAGENSTLTPAADIYSLGGVFYEMVSGSVPFRAPLLELLRRIKSELPTPLTTLRPDVDPALSAIAMRAMAKAPADRFESAAEMAAALRGWLATDGATTAVQETLPSEQTHKAQPRPWTIRLSLMALAAMAIAVVVGQLPHKNAAEPARPDNPLAVSAATLAVGNTAATVAPLTGDFAITISSDPAKGPVTKSRLRIEERGAYPLRNGELVQFEVHLNRPAYVYLLWVTPDGSVTPLFPWDAEHFEGFAAPHIVGSDRPTDNVLCPRGRNAGFEAVDPVGLQTFVMLARQEPLAAGIDLARVLAELPAGPELDPGIAAMQPRLRGIKTGQTKALDQALFVELENRLSPHFELVRMMTFPQVRE